MYYTKLLNFISGKWCLLFVLYDDPLWSYYEFTFVAKPTQRQIRKMAKIAHAYFKVRNNLHLDSKYDIISH